MIIHDGATFHLTWQCHNRSWLLKEEWAKKLYYDLLLKWKDHFKVSIHSYNLMDNHPHLAGTVQRKEGISKLMHKINCIFAKRYNKAKGRRGQVVMDRFKTSNIQTDEHLIQVIIYQDLNPCRARKVKHPRNYRWTSYHYYAYGKPDPLITPAISYLALADDPKARQEIYREMVDQVLANSLCKKDYSTVHFIGDPDWVKSSYERLTNKMKEIRINGQKRRIETDYKLCDDLPP